MSSTLPCPQGGYCSGGNSVATPCPAGTYSNRTGLQAVGECTPCDAGAACTTTGLTAPNQPCSAGYVCYSGAATTTPNDGGITGSICPTGAYCPVSSAAPVLCAAGTYQPMTGRSSITACIQCTPGMTCSVSGLAAPDGLCPAGLFCPLGTGTPTLSCPLGHACLQGSSAPRPCDPGLYQNQTGQSLCITCDEGYYCGLGSISPSLCLPGRYCVRGTSYADEYLCPARTYNPLSGSIDSLACLTCPPGYYCPIPGTSVPQKCGPNYYCSNGAMAPQPQDGGVTGGPCDAGFECGYGSWTPRPGDDGSAGSNWTAVGQPCPAGTRSNTGEPCQGCPPGTYQPSQASTLCLISPAGRYAPGNSSDALPCPPRSYCPRASGVPTLCPNGTYTLSTGLAEASECTTCPPRKFCQGGEVVGDCAAGYICLSGSPTARPEQDPLDLVNFVPSTVGYPCPSGYYCLAGAIEPSSCPNGTFSAVLRASSTTFCGPCPAGYTCRDGTVVPDPCPRGYWCDGSGRTVACPAFTVQPFFAATNASACLASPAGTFINETAAFDSSLYLCPVGHYCTAGTRAPMQCPAGRYRDIRGARSALECYQCPGGRYCPVGTVVPILSPPTTFSPPGSGNWTICPSGSYCPAGTAVPIVCPAAHACPVGVEGPSLCPLGTYAGEGSAYCARCPAGYFAPPDSTNVTRASIDTACTPCPAGTYSSTVSDGGGTLCLPCPPGYVCLGATNSATPKEVSRDRGYACRPGYYCPEGSSAEIACPIGTFSSLEKRWNASDCVPCFNGTYNHLPGQASCKPCSSSAYTLTAGSSRCECRGLYRSFQMTDGFCVCAPGYQFLDADYRVLSESDGEVDCQPIQFEWCESGQSRLANGKCAAIDCNSQCKSRATSPSAAAGVSGSFNAQMGICTCEGLDPPSAICDSACRAGSIKMNVDAVTGNLVITDPTGGPNSTSVSTVIDPRNKDALPGLVGSLQCITRAQQAGMAGLTSSASSAPASTVTSNVLGGNATVFNSSLAGGSECKVHSIDLSANKGIRGMYNAPALVAGAVSSAVSAATGGGRRRLLQSLLFNSEHAEYVLSAAASLSRRRQLAYAHALRLGASADAASSFVTDVAFDQAAFQTNVGLFLPKEQPADTYPQTLAVDAASGKRRLASSSGTDTGPTINSPVVCLEMGQSVIWQLSSGKDTFPVYIKDSFLNTNPSFDYGPFRSLASLASNNASSITMFAFTFTQNGTYVFGSSTDATAIMIVRVMGPGQTCPVYAADAVSASSSSETSVFAPMTSQALVSMGITQDGDPILAPNWMLIGSLIGGLLFFSLVVIGGLFYFRYKAWGDMSGWRRRRLAGIKGSAGLGEAMPAAGGKGKIFNTLFGGSGITGPSGSNASGNAGGGAMLGPDGKPLPWYMQADAAKEAAKGKTTIAVGGNGTGMGKDGATSTVSPPPGISNGVSPAGNMDPAAMAMLAAASSNWDPADLDLFELVQRLKAHQGDVASAFKDQHETAERILATLKEEARTLRGAITSTAVEAGAATLTGEKIPGAKAAAAARRAAVLRQIEAELAARALHDRSMARREGEIITCLHALAGLLRHDDVASLAAEVISQLMEAAAGSEEEAADMDVSAYVAATRKLKPETASAAYEEVRVATQHVKELIANALAAVNEERTRRAQAVALWKAAATSGVLTLGGSGADLPSMSASGPSHGSGLHLGLPFFGHGASSARGDSSARDNQGIIQLSPSTIAAITAVLELLETGMEPVDSAQAAALETLQLFATGCNQFLTTIKTDLSTFISELAKAREQQNPSVIDRVRAAGERDSKRQYHDLSRGVAAVLGRLPPQLRKLELARARSSNALVRHTSTLASARAAAELEAEQLRVTRAGAGELMAQISRLIDKARNGGFAKNLISGRRGYDDGTGDGDDDGIGLGAAFSVMDAERRAKLLEDESLPKGQREMAAMLVALVEAEAKREQRAIAEKMANVAAAEKAKEEERNKASAKAARSDLENNANLTEHERQRLLREYEQDQAALQSAMEAERQRQAAELARKLDDKKKERLNARLKRAERQAAAEAEAKAKAELESLKKKQEEERKKLEEEEAKLAASELSSSASQAAAAEDTTFSAVEAAINRIRQGFERHVDAMESSLEPERTKRVSLLHKQLLERKEKRLKALRLQQASELAQKASESGGDTAAREQLLLSKHRQELEQLFSSLEQEDAADVRAAQTSAAERLKELAATASSAAAEAAAQLLKCVPAIDAETANRTDAARKDAQAAKSAALKDLTAKHKAEMESAQSSTGADDAALSSIKARQAVAVSDLEAAWEGKEEAAVRVVEQAELAARANLSAAQLSVDLQSAKASAAIEAERLRLLQALDGLRGEYSLQSKQELRRTLELMKLQAQQAKEMKEALGDPAKEQALQAKHDQETEQLLASLGRKEEDEATAASREQEAKSKSMSEQIAKLHSGLERDMEALRSKLMSERARQHASVASRLAERKAKREKALKRKQEAQLAAAASSAAVNNDSVSSQAAVQNALVAAHQRQLDDVHAADAAAAEEASKAAAAGDSIIRGQVEMEAQILRIKAQHEAEQDALSSSTYLERQRQQQSLQRRLAQRRNERERRLRAQQESEAFMANKAGAAPADMAELARQHDQAANAEEERLAAEEAAQQHQQDQQQKLQQGTGSGSSASQKKKKEDVEEQAARIREQFETEREKHAAAIQGESRRQKAGLEARLQQRKAKRLRELQRRQEADFLEAEKKAAAAAASGAAAEGGDDGEGEQQLGKTAAQLSQEAEAVARIEAQVRRALKTSNDGSSDSSDASSAAEDEEIKRKAAALEAENEKRKRELQEKQERERKQAEAEAAAELQKRIQQEEESRKAALDAKRKEMETRLAAAAAAGASGGAAEVERLRKEHENELASYEATMEEERRRQKEKLDKQLEARRAKKERELKRKQDQEMADEMARQEASKRELEAAAAAKREKEAILAALQAEKEKEEQEEAERQRRLEEDGDAEPSSDKKKEGSSAAAAASDAIEAVMQSRHAKETADLLARQYNERANALRNALEALFERKRDEAADLLEGLREANNGTAPPQADIDAAMQALNAKYETEKAAVEKGVVEDCEVKHANEQLALRTRQLSELADALRELNPEDVIRRHEAEEAQKQAAELAAFQAKMLAEKNERLARIKAEKEAFAEALKKANEEEMARLDAEHAAQLDAERKRSDEQLKARRDRLAKEQDELKRQKLEEVSSLDMETRDKVMKEFENERAKVEAKLEEVRAQQQSKLEARLAAKREKQKRSKERELAEALRAQETKASLEAAAAAEAAAKAKQDAEAKAKAKAEAEAAAAASSKAATSESSPVPQDALLRNAVEQAVAKSAAIGNSGGQSATGALAEALLNGDDDSDEYGLGKAAGAQEGGALAPVLQRLAAVEEMAKTLVSRFAAGTNKSSPLAATAAPASSTEQAPAAPASFAAMLASKANANKAPQQASQSDFASPPAYEEPGSGAFGVAATTARGAALYVDPFDASEGNLLSSSSSMTIMPSGDGGGQLVVQPTASLPARELIRLQFAQKCANSIMVGASPLPAATVGASSAYPLSPSQVQLLNGIKVLAASSLPALVPPSSSATANGNYANNAYCASYAFDSASATLYLRLARLGAAGDTMMITAHACAHIRSALMLKRGACTEAGTPASSSGSDSSSSSGGGTSAAPVWLDLSEDTEPVFMGEFHRALKACGQELFRQQVAFNHPQHQHYHASHQHAHSSTILVDALSGGSGSEDFSVPSLSSAALGANSRFRRASGAISLGSPAAPAFVPGGVNATAASATPRSGGGGGGGGAKLADLVMRLKKPSAAAGETPRGDGSAPGDGKSSGGGGKLPGLTPRGKLGNFVSQNLGRIKSLGAAAGGDTNTNTNANNSATGASANANEAGASKPAPSPVAAFLAGSRSPAGLFPDAASGHFFNFDQAAGGSTAMAGAASAAAEADVAASTAEVAAAAAAAASVDATIGVADRLTRAGAALSRRENLKSYLQRLEQEILRPSSREKGGDDDGESSGSGSGNDEGDDVFLPAPHELRPGSVPNSRQTSSGGGTRESAVVDGYHASLKASLSAIENAIDKGQQMYLQRVSARGEAAAAVAELEVSLEMKEALLARVVKKANKSNKGASQPGEDEDDDDDDDEEELLGTSLPSKASVEADIRHLQRRLADAKGELQRAGAALDGTTERLAKLEDQRADTQKELDKLETALNANDTTAAYKIASAAATTKAAAAASSSNASVGVGGAPPALPRAPRGSKA